MAAAPKRHRLATVGLAVVFAAMAAGGPAMTAEPKKPKGEGLAGLIPGLNRKPKLPELRVIKRFADPAYPAHDPNYVAKSMPTALFGGAGPLQAKWRDSVGSIQATMDRIVAAGPRPQQRVTVIISSSHLSNAAALDSGYIIVTSTLLDHIETLSMNNNEVANDYLVFILAHEYAHVLMKHQQQNEKARANYENLGNAVRLAGTVYVISKAAKADKAPSRAAHDKEMFEALGVLIATECASDLLQSETGRAFLPGFAKETERDADMLAADLSRRVGRNPVLGAGSLAATQADNKRRIQQSSKAMRDAQKLAGDTAKAIAPLLPLAAATGDLDEIKNALMWLVALNALNLTMTWLDDRAQLNNIGLHDDPADRLALVKEYVSVFPKETDITEQAPLKTDFKKMGLELKAKRATDDARRSLEVGDVEGARDSINQALASPIGKSGEVQEVAAAVAMAERKYDVAITALREVIKTYPNEDIYLRLAKAYRLKQDKAGALKALSEGATKTGNPGPFLVMKLEIHREANDEPQVQKALAECKALNQPRFTRVCEEVAKPPPPPPEATPAPGQTAQKPGSTPGTMVDGFLKKVGVLPPEPPPPPPPAAPKPKPKPKPRRRTTPRRSHRLRPTPS